MGRPRRLIQQLGIRGERRRAPIKLRTSSIDLGKNVVHLVGVNLRGEVVVYKKFARKQLLHPNDLIGRGGQNHNQSRAARCHLTCHGPPKPLYWFGFRNNIDDCVGSNHNNYIES
jgi:hypothetical protein